MEKVVHLDLKGAPLKVPYLKKVIQSAKLWGATGVLLEWEDTFPYTREVVEVGSLSNTGGDGMYTVQEIKHILMFCKEIQIEAIQLIQTIGHLEFVLKHPAFRGLRELPKSPAVLCPSKQDSLKLVKIMLEQALELQPDAKYLHIGADEVWHLGVCPECKQIANNNQLKLSSLFLCHIRELCLFLKQKWPQVSLLMWDDMLRSMPTELIQAYNLNNLVSPVVWHYNSGESFQIMPDLWQKYKNTFPSVWAGTAYKGANGSARIVSSVAPYVSNNDCWRKEMQKYSEEINFVGVILTGWSRFDHYATLCELLPVSLPSLANCLRVLTKTDEDSNASYLNETLPSNEWPGEELARSIHSFVALKDRCLAFVHGDIVTTWLNPWQVKNKYTNPIQVGSVVLTAHSLLNELASHKSDISRRFEEVTGPRSLTEFLETHLTPLEANITEIRDCGIERCQNEASVKPAG